MTVSPSTLALHAALWGEPDDVLDAIDRGTWRLQHFTDPTERTTATAILDLVLAGEVPEVAAVHAALVAKGIDQPTAAAMVTLSGAFEAAGCLRGGLHHFLHILAEDQTRAVVMARLVALADAVDRPGGPERVAVALGVTA